MMAKIAFTQAQSPEEIERARELFREYEAWVEVNLCFQGFENELASLPGDYQPPRGRLLLAQVDQQLAGCVAMRDLGEETCEMKRLYLRPEFQGQGLGRALAEKIIESARETGYQRMRLDTITGKMDSAISLYRSLGFKEIPAYYSNPFAGVKYMELAL